jgi:hypothetical protein
MATLDEKPATVQVGYASPKQQAPAADSLKYLLGWLCLFVSMCMVVATAAFLYLTEGLEDVPPYAIWLLIGAGLMFIASLHLSRKKPR